MRTFISYLLFVLLSVTAQAKPLRVVIAGLTHGHVNGLFYEYRHGQYSNMQIVGIAEPDTALWHKYGRLYHLPDSLFTTDLPGLIQSKHPDAVWAFNAANQHLSTIAVCAPLRIPVMVEKPLAATLNEAKAIAALAKQYQTLVVVNLETTWYPTNQELYKRSQKGDIGTIRKMVVHDGHEGPKERGVPPEFLNWLTDPIANGAGALNDFGCYGADLMTWLMKGQRPTSVTAVLRHDKPAVYPKVDDDATILLTYPDAEGIIQASWDWPYSIKDLEVFGEKGYYHAANERQLFNKMRGESEPKLLPVQDAPGNDPISCLAAMIQGQHPPGEALSSLSYNLVVMEILDAAKRSAKSGKTIKLKMMNL